MMSHPALMAAIKVTFVLLSALITDTTLLNSFNERILCIYEQLICHFYRYYMFNGDIDESFLTIFFSFSYEESCLGLTVLCLL